MSSREALQPDRLPAITPEHRGHPVGVLSLTNMLRDLLATSCLVLTSIATKAIKGCQLRNSVMPILR